MAKDVSNKLKPPKKAKNLNKKTFGYWKVLNYAGILRYRQCYWKCRCKCGTEKILNGAVLRSGMSKSCGCWNRERLLTKGTHRHTSQGRQSAEFTIWMGMLDRCRNKNNPAWQYYGGRGIKVCKRWLGPKGFQNFLADMGSRPSGKSIDRKNNDGNYTPRNCRWATAAEQARNKSTTKKLKLHGKTQTIADWAEEYDLPYKLIWKRIHNWGWSLAKALTTPRDYKSPIGPAVAAHTKHVFEHAGRSQTLASWARELGIKYITLYNRVITRKMTLSEAIRCLIPPNGSSSIAST